MFFFYRNAHPLFQKENLEIAQKNRIKLAIKFPLNALFYFIS